MFRKDDNKSSMRVDLEGCVQRLKELDRITILGHVSPDGDCIGSAYALCRFLQRKGKLVEVKFPDPIPKRFQFMEDWYSGDIFESEVAVAVDMGSISQLGSYDYYKSNLALCIDHHANHTDVAELELVQWYASTCELLLQLFLYWDDVHQSIQLSRPGILEEMYGVDETIAKCLYVGMHTDTGGFRYPNTNSGIFQAAMILTNQYPDLSKLGEIIWQESMSLHQAWVTGDVLRSTNQYLVNREDQDPLKLVVMKFTNNMRREVWGSTNPAVWKDRENEIDLSAVHNLGKQIDGYDVAAYLEEDPDQDNHWTVSFRSPADGPDVGKLAKALGGGGHQHASGCQYTGDARQLIQTIMHTMEVLYMD